MTGDKCLIARGTTSMTPMITRTGIQSVEEFEWNGNWPSTLMLRPSIYGIHITAHVHNLYSSAQRLYGSLVPAALYAAIYTPLALQCF